MGNTVKSFKTAGKAAKTTGKATATATRFTITHWRGLLPLLCLGGAGVFAAVTHLLTWLVDTWEAKALIAAVGLVLFVWADGWVGQLDLAKRPPAIGFVLFTTAATLALILVPGVGAVYVAIVVGDLVLGTWWWNGAAYRSFRATERATRKMELILRKLGVSVATRITSVKQNNKGDMEWRLYLGDSDRPAQIKADDIAHMLKTDVSQVIVRRVERGSSRSVKIVHLGKSPEKSADPVHPAVRAENRGSGAEWEPGTRSILDGLVSGSQLGAAEPAIVRYMTTKGADVRHIGILGATGSGKTSTTSGVLLSAIACTDLVVGVCDIPKAGNLGAPFASALHRVAITYAELEADLRGLLALGADRIRRMNEGEVLSPDGKKLRKWRASRQDPIVLYKIDELGNTMRDLEVEDPDKAMELWDLLISVAQSVRQAGIAIGWASQDAKKESINTTFRKAMGSYVVHRVATAQCVNGIFTEFDVDMFDSGLPSAGMHWAGDIDGGSPVKAIGFDMDSSIEAGTEFDAAVAAYAPHRPFLRPADVAVLGWGDTLCGGAAVQALADQPIEETAPVAEEAAVNAMNLLRDAFGDELPDGAPIIGGAAELSEADQERLTAIITALAQAEQLSRAEIQQAAGLGMTVTKNLLTALIDDGKVVREGQGKSTKYRLAQELASA